MSHGQGLPTRNGSPRGGRAPRAGGTVRHAMTDAQRRRLFPEQVMPLVERLYRTALQYTHDPHDAEDLVQEALTAAYRAFHQYEQGTNLHAWLQRTLYNTFATQHRRQQSRPQELPCEAIATIAPGERALSDAPVDRQVLERLADSEVKQALRALPLECRLLVYLVDVEGLSYAAAAQTASLRRATVGSRLRRARKSLRRDLTDYARSRRLLR